MNGEGLNYEDERPSVVESASASGLQFRGAHYIRLQRNFEPGEKLLLTLNMPLILRYQDKRIHGCGGMVALTRGPVVYCLENMDNTGDIFSAEVDASTLENHYDPDLLEGVVRLSGRSFNGTVYKFIPYMLWGNRGESKMTVFFVSKGGLTN